MLKTAHLNFDKKSKLLEMTACYKLLPTATAH
jgi:hypothetical protein